MREREDFTMSDGSTVNMAALWEKVAKGPRCWEWQGATVRFGHGKILSTRDGRHLTAYVHRAVWEATRGPIPAGLLVTHECDNPRCVNPDHLATGTQLDNIRGGIARGRHIGRRFQSHCMRGHPFSGPNLLWRGGRRVCLACEHVRGRAKATVA